MNRFILALALSSLMLAGCANSPPSPQARSQIDAAAPNSTADDVPPPMISRPIVTPDGNTIQCTAYAGGNTAGDCVQR